MSVFDHVEALQGGNKNVHLALFRGLPLTLQSVYFSVSTVMCGREKCHVLYPTQS